MDILVIGGNRFVGQLLVWRLLARGHRVTVLNRGNLKEPFGSRVERLRADRTTDAFNKAVEARTFDATVDFAAFRGEDVKRVEQALGKRAGHYILISTGQVYLVCRDAPRPASEKHFDLPLFEEPPKESADHSEWGYGMGKRAAEQAATEAGTRGTLAATRLRIPMVNGELDYYRRMESYLWRILDRGPVLVTQGLGADCRHVYGHDVAAAIVELIGLEKSFGQAYNLSQDHSVKVREMVEILAMAMGTKAEVVEVGREELLAKGIPPEQISPFSQRWMSCLDPARAMTELGFRPTPLTEYVPRIVASFLARPPESPPDNYRFRELELGLR